MNYRRGKFPRDRARSDGSARRRERPLSRRGTTGNSAPAFQLLAEDRYIL
jgi:hypothetical protein